MNNMNKMIVKIHEWVNIQLEFFFEVLVNNKPGSNKKKNIVNFRIGQKSPQGSKQTTVKRLSTNYHFKTFIQFQLFSTINKTKQLLYSFI